MNGQMTPFGAAVYRNTDPRGFLRAAKQTGLTRAQAKVALNTMLRRPVWVNDQYQVSIDKEPPHGFGPDVQIWHLSIKRLDRAPIHDWRDLQQIKNLLVGPEHEAIELYPAESRVVDTANQFHLFVFVREGDQAAPRVPVGWTTGARSNAAYGQSVQRHIEGESK